MSDDFRVAPSDYPPRYSPGSLYAPSSGWAWNDPADEHDRTSVLWTPPGHAYPVLASDREALAAAVPGLTTDYAEEAKSA